MSEPVAAPAPAAAPAEAPVVEPVNAAPVAEETETYEIDGKTVELTRTQARTLLQKAGAVDKRLQQATETQKKLDALIAAFEADPEAALSKLGKDPAKVIENMLAKRAALELMTTEQRETAALKEERDALKAAADKATADKKAAAEAELDEHNSRALEEQLVSIADKHGLDATPETLEGLCQVAIDLSDLGLVPTAEQVGQEFMRREAEALEAYQRKVRPRLKGDRLKSYLKEQIPSLVGLPPEELLELLGPDGVKAVLSATLVKAKPASKPATATVKSTRRGPGGKFLSEAQFDSKYRR